MIHVRSDFDAIQPWPTKRAHVARQDGRVVRVPVDARSSADVETQIATGRLQPIIPDDEPVLLIRGHDPLAFDLCVDYADRAEAIGCDPELVAAVRRHADAIGAWAAAHPHGPADAPPGTLR